jgi:hypothetical protein
VSPSGIGAKILMVSDLEPASKTILALLKNEWVPRRSGRSAKAVSKGSPHPQPRPIGGAVLAAGRAREPGAARLYLAGALKRRAGFGRLKGSLRRATPALDPFQTPKHDSLCPIQFQ